MSSPNARQSWLPLVVLATGVSMVVVDATIVNVAVPAIIADLRVGATDVEWINSVYSLMFAALLIPFGRIGDLRGRRRLFGWGITVFLAASVLAATSVNGPMLIAVRAVQGAGAAMAVPMTLAIINSLYLGRRRVIAFAVWGSVIGGMAAAGPLLGGWLVTEYGWRAAFWVNLPIGALVLLGTLRVPESRDEHAAGHDLPGVALAALGTTGVVFALIEGQKYGWLAPRRTADLFGLRFEEVSPVPFALAAGLAALAALVVLERRRARAGRPVLVDLTLFELPSFRYGAVAAMIVALGEFGLILVLPLFLQSALDYTAFDAGLVIATLALGTFLAGGLVPALSRRLSARTIVRAGLVLEAVGAAGIGLSLAPGMDFWRPVPWLLAYGVGVGLATAQLTGVLMADVPARRSGQASALQSTIRQLGAALGVAVLGGVLVTGLGSAVERRLADLPEQVRTSVARAVEESAGAVIPALRSPADPAPHSLTDPAPRSLTYPAPRSGAIHAAAVESAAEATRRVTVITALVLLAGVGATLLLPRTPVARNESRERTAAATPDTGGHDPDV